MKRTVLRSPKGVKYYACWNADDKFLKVDLYKTCHGRDIKRSSKEERAKKL